MKQGGAESCGSETRMLERLLMKDKGELLLCHSRPLPLLPVMPYEVKQCCVIILDIFE